ncbi:MAG: sulfatase-like hydrolase/transferase, partial [Muribaculaceae bacterium]|nr:sulfatase-like hydrolase/transferase [Muribaculaceae bacterium]
MNIRYIFSALPLTLVPVAVHAAQSDTIKDQRPDIILFMVDDMGWQDTSVPFWNKTTHYNRAYETPNMERLAAQGVKFTQAYACAISSPSRCSLLTGANNARHRVTNWTLERDRSTDDSVAGITLPSWNWNGIAMVDGTPNTYVGSSFVDLLKRNGYHTIHCGKAHFGALDTPGENPAHWGFEVNIAGHAAGGLATYLSEKNYGHNPDGTPYSL